MTALLVDRSDNGIVSVTLNQPERKNAINLSMFEDLLAIFEEVTNREEDRVLVQNIEGTWYTTGDHYQLLVANIEYALADPEIRPKLVAYLKDKSSKL